MPTRIGFFLFVGLFLGAVVGTQLPFVPSLEAVAGGVIGVILAFVFDKPSKTEESE